MTKRRNRSWTANDAANLARLWREGYDDVALAYIMNRSRSVIRRHRVKLGPSNGKPNCHGPTHTPESRAHLSEIMRRRWETDRATLEPMALASIAKARAVSNARRWRTPAADRKLYRKLREALGVKEARKQIGVR